MVIWKDVGKESMRWRSQANTAALCGQLLAPVDLSSQCSKLAENVGVPIHAIDVTSPPYLCHHLAWDQCGHLTPQQCLAAQSLPEPLQGHQSLGLLSESPVLCHLNPWSHDTPSDKFIT